MKKINSEIKWGCSFLFCYVLWAFLWFITSCFVKGSLSAPYFPQGDITKELQTPLQGNFILGADLYGRSLWETLSVGLHYSLAVALMVSLISAFLGLVMGHLCVAGPKKTRMICDTLTNLVFIFPSILVAIMVMAMLGQSFWGLVFALIITGWPGYARIARGEIKRIMGLTYVESARAVGISEARLFFTVIIPSIFPVFLVHVVLGMGGVIVSEAALGFLGLGGSPYSWGAMLASSKMVLLEAPHFVIVLSLAMAGLIIGLNLTGDGLRDYLDTTA